MSNPESLTDQLSAAVKAGDLALVDSLYSQYSSSHESLDEIAQQAARHALPELLEWCFQRGFTFPADSMNNPFYHAVVEGTSPAVFQVLLKRGFDLNAHWSEYLGDALVAACMDGNIPLVRFLLENGQDPNSGHCCSDYEALTWTIVGDKLSQSEKKEIVRLMLEHSTRLEGTGAVAAAAEEENLELLEMLFDNGGSGLLEDTAIWWSITDRESIDSEGTPLYRACRAGKTEAAKFLLDRGANGRSKDKVGRSCLDVARAAGHDKVVELLKGRGVDE